MARAGASTHWFMTINNPTYEDGEAFLGEKEVLASHLKYLMLGSHKGEKRQTPHIHAVIWTTKRLRLTALKKLHPRANIQTQRGTIEDCATYLNKEGIMQEWGTRPTTLSERNKRDWDSAFLAAKEDRLEDIPKGMLIRYYHAFKRIRQDNPVKPEDLKTKQNYWITAPSQYGKSTYARERWPDYYDKAPNRWYTGYRGEETVLCDDYGPQQCQYLHWYMKRWADLFSYPVETKGGGFQTRPKHIVVTSQNTIEECFLDEKVCEAIKNRFTVINLTHWKKRINFK